MSLIKISTFPERLKESLDETGVSVTDLASSIGMSKQAISSYITGNRMPKRPVINAISEALNRNPMYLLGYDIDKHIPANNAAKGIKIPVLGNVQAGIPVEAVQDILDEEEIEPSMALTGEYFALKIKGNSMEPRIFEGDVVIVRRQPDVENGTIAVVLVNGQDATVKIVEKNDDGIVLIALNPTAYTPHFYTNKQIEELPLTIIGKVVELRGKFA